MSDCVSTNIVWQQAEGHAQKRCVLLEQSGQVIWLCGLSGSGKSTIALALADELLSQGRLVYCLDGDNMRHGLNQDLGFSDADRAENIRRTAEVAKLMQDAGLIVLVSCITPQQAMRETAAQIVRSDHITQVFVKASIETCQQRDPKGLYQKAAAGDIQQFTGIHQGFEEPANADVVIDTESITVADAVHKILEQMS